MGVDSKRQDGDGAAGRLNRGPAPELVQTANRLEVAQASVLYDGLSLADLAHTLILVEQGIVPPESGRELLRALLQLHDTPPDEFPFDPAWGDVYQNRERQVAHMAPRAAGWLRAGRARRDATNVAYHLAVRWRLLRLVDAVVQLARTLVDRAEEHVDTLMPDYTYLQPAQPTTLGHYLLGFVYPLLRDLERLRLCLQRINLSPGGIGSVNGSRLGLDRDRLAHLLGFDGAVHHTRDAMWQADLPIEATAAAVALLVTLDRLAEDLQIWHTQEFGLVELDEAYSRGSVIMPQKKNPYSLAYLRGLANVAIGQLVAVANVGRTPTGQPDNRIFVYGEVPRVLDQAAEAVQLLAGVVGTLVVHAEQMARRAGRGYSQSTDLAEAIMLATGLPYEVAHRVVGRAVAAAVRSAQPAAQISAERLDAAALDVLGCRLHLSEDLLAEVLDPRAIVSTRIGLGGAAPAAMAPMLEECRSRLAEAEVWHRETERRLARAEADLVEQARRIALETWPEQAGRVGQRYEALTPAVRYVDITE